MDEKFHLENTCKKLCNCLLANLSNKCIICTEHINEGVLLIPCSHYQICKKCFLKIDSKCPQCRTGIEYYLEYNKINSVLNKNDNYETEIQNQNALIENYVQETLTEELYEMEYILYHINNRHLPYDLRVAVRRLNIAGYNLGNISNSIRRSDNNIIRQSRNRFRTWWPET